MQCSKRNKEPVYYVDNLLISGERSLVEEEPLPKRRILAILSSLDKRKARCVKEVSTFFLFPLYAETDTSTEKTTSRANTRIPCTHAHQRRPHRTRPSSRPRTQARQHPVKKRKGVNLLVSRFFPSIVGSLGTSFEKDKRDRSRLEKRSVFFCAEHADQSRADRKYVYTVCCGYRHKSRKECGEKKSLEKTRP